MKCELWSEARGRKFLEDRSASSLYLLHNLAQHGPALGDKPNSGNFRMLVEGNEVRAVYSLTRRGNLLVSGVASAELLEACRGDGVAVKAVIGDWECASAVWKLLASPSCSFSSREILYRLDTLPSAGDSAARLLTPADYPHWKNIPRSFNREVGLAIDLTDEQIREAFERLAAANEHWGLFEGDRLVSVASLNARVLGFGQVGGVYTFPDRRGHGLSKRVMSRLLRDCAEVHGLGSVILFTGEKNFAAQRVYESLGFRRIGWFGIFFA